MKRLWNRLLILLRIRFDWDKHPEVAPPAFENVQPHVYDPEIERAIFTDGRWHNIIEQLPYCAQCGAGEKHSIHVQQAVLKPASPLRRYPDVHA